MSTEATIQVLDSAVETAGVSTITATRTVVVPRNGTIYNPTTFAAAVPVWFHRRQDGRYLGLFKKYWASATAAYNAGPQAFSAHTEFTDPAYVVIDPTTGTCDGPYPLPGASGTMILNTAVSRGDYLFTLGTKDGVAWVQHFVITRYGGLQLQGEEAVPLNLSMGLYADGFHLHVFGADGDGHLTHIHKNWARIGINTDPNMQWEYEGLKGWYTYVDETLPMATLPFGTIPVAGPVTVAKFRDRLYLTVVEFVAGAYSARTYTARSVDVGWRSVSSSVIPLGDSTTYMGGGAYLQPQLVVNKALLPDGVNTGFPYVTSTKAIFGSNQAILTEWGILTV